MQRSKAPQPTVSYPGHPHLLAVLEDMPSNTYSCNECRVSCKSTPFFHCTYCNFNLHLRCGPLPETIKSKYHVDLLTLADQYAVDNSGEYHCDLCEKRRDPRNCVYVCSKCNFVAHLSCVMLEVLSSIKGEKGDVELRTLYKLIPGRVVSKGSNSETTAQWEKEIPESSPTLKEIYNSLTQNEKEELKKLSKGPTDNSSDTSTASSSGNSGDPFKQLLKTIDAAEVSQEELKKLYESDAKVVNVGEHQVTWEFKHIMKKLVDKHEKLIAESSLRPKLKTLMFVLLCELVWRMCRTKIEKVTEDMLKNWRGRLKVVQRANFQVEFVMDHLTKAVGAYLGLRENKKKG